MLIRQYQTDLVKPANLLTTILLTGFFVGSLDGLAAIINYLVAGGKEPAKIFQFIASGAFGRDAYSGHEGMIYLGVMFHYAIAYMFTIFFFLLARRMKWLSEHKLVGGIPYGIFIWLVMTFVVLPVTKIPPGVIHLKPALVGITILIIAVGLPLSYLASAYYSKTKIDFTETDSLP